MVGFSLFTSESVTEGHPDKMADQISDAVLDALLEQDPYSRVACETLLTTGLVVLAGEISTKAQVDFQKIARSVIQDVGYDSSEKGFDYKTCAVMLSIGQQSPDIAQGVSSSQSSIHPKEQGAGDQGLMFGYAIRESEELMPLSIHYAHQLALRLSHVRKQAIISGLRPDGKTQVTFEYENGIPQRVRTVVVSTQHDENFKYSQLKEAIVEGVIRKAIPSQYLTPHTQYLVNPTGRFVVGGPMGDCGLTGRKIIVDTYGGHGAHGGGAFSGKDPSKVDRSACYMGRYVAKNLVASGLVDRCLVQIAYAIGVAEPVSVMVNGFGTEKIPIAKMEEIVKKVFQFKPAQIIQSLQLLRPIYRKTASYGHFGRAEPSFFWEKTDRVELLRSYSV